MSRLLSAAGMAAVGITLATTLIFAEPGFATDLGADVAVPTLAYPSQDQLDESADLEAPVTGDQTKTEQQNEKSPLPQEPTEELVTAESLAELVAKTDKPKTIDAELRCLAGAVYFESRGESLPGQLAVAHVVINRAKSGRFPQTLCGVVHQPAQFSFIRGGKMPAIREGHMWDNAVAIARIARDGSWKNHAEGALYFHARHVSPRWNKRRIATIDNHIFYR
jgi:spore germination cell wall hydrolase CwlJ-like protein